MGKFDNMGKEELRAECRKAGISYGKLNNDGMRKALVDANIVVTEDGGIAGPSLLDLAVEEAAKTPVIETNIGPASAIEKAAATELATSKRKRPKKAAAPRKVRLSANGVTVPSSGTICGAIWAALDAKRTELKGETPSFEHLRELAKEAGWQKNTAMTQYQRWKQFNGLMPRSLGGANDAGSV